MCRSTVWAGAPSATAGGACACSPARPTVMLVATRLRFLGAGGCSSGWHVHLHREHRPQSAQRGFLHPHVLEGSIFSHLQPHFLHFLQVEHVPRLHRQRPMTTAQAGRGGSKWKICVVKESVCALLKSGSSHRIINCSVVKLMRGTPVARTTRAAPKLPHSGRFRASRCFFPSPNDL